MKNTTLTIVRHGESTLNLINAISPSFFPDSKTRDSFKNIPDHRVPLSPRGITQASQTGEFLSIDGLDYDVAVHTGYTRTKQTLEQILTSVKVPKVLE